MATVEYLKNPVQNTLNVGTNNSGQVSAVNIALSGGSSNPYISVGQNDNTGSQGYDETGVFLGMDSGTFKLSLKIVKVII